MTPSFLKKQNGNPWGGSLLLQQRSEEMLVERCRDVLLTQNDSCARKVSLTFFNYTNISVETAKVSEEI